MNIRTLTLTYRSMQRLREIVVVFSRYGFQQILQTSGLSRYLPVSHRVRRGEEGPEHRAGGPERLRMALQELGPTFVKLGQMLASRPDLVPEVYAEEFRKLQDHVQPISFADVRAVIETELGAPLEELFTSVEEEPLAAASIAQVHRAKLLNGESVVIKVRRPGIERTITSDLAVLRIVAEAIEHYMVEARPLALPMIVDEFSRAIRKELDFILEAANVERFAKNFAGVHEVVIPRIRWDVTTQRMMVMDEVEGFCPNDAERFTLLGPEARRSYARIISRAFMKQVLEDGVFHADMHAGNIRFTEDGRVALLDFGSVGFLSERSQDSLGGFFTALLTHDYAALVDEFVRIGAMDAMIDSTAFERDLREMVEPYHGRPLGEIRMGEVLREAVSIAVRHSIKVPPEMVLLGRASITVEGLVRRIDPEINVIDEATPFAKKLLMHRFDPRRQLRRASKVARDYGDLVAKLPTQVTRIFQKILESKLTIEFVHKGYDKALDEIDRSSNRISASLMISAVIVGSSLIVLSGKGPQLWGFPAMGIAGYVIAGILGLGLAIQILRSGKF